MPTVERLSHALSKAPLIRGASTLTNHDEVYEMTRRHIDKGIPLGILIDQDGMTLVPTNDIVKTPTGAFRWYELKDGRIDHHIRVRFEEGSEPPKSPPKDTFLLGIPEKDAYAYCGFTVVEVFSK